jgi:hypothetical protein
MSAPRVIIAEFDRNTREKIRIALDDYRGTTTIDIRVWYLDGLELKPGRQGLTTSVQNLPAPAAGLKLALDRAREMGLV